MKAREIITALLGTILKIAVAVVVIFYVYKGALLAHDYGYRVFAEPAVAEEGKGKDVTVEVTAGANAREVGELLLSKGLIRDANLFYIQNLLSEYKDKLQPGVYTLNTSMTVKEMMEIMGTVPEAEESTAGSETDE